MKLLEIEEMSPNEIQEQVKKSRLELLELHMKLATRQLDNPSLIKKKRLDIARLLTIQTQKLQHKPEADLNLQATSEKSDEKDKKTENRKKKKKSEDVTLESIEDVKKKKKGLLKK